MSPTSQAFVQHFAADDASLSSMIQVNANELAMGQDHPQPTVASTADGRYVVVWRYQSFDGPRTGGIFAQRFSPTDLPRGTQP